MFDSHFIKDQDYRCYLKAIAALVILWLFERYVTDIFGFIADVLSNCEQLPLIIILITLSLGLSVYCLCKTFGKRKEVVSHKQIALLLLIATVYAYYRFRSSSPFVFGGVDIAKCHFAWVDWLWIPLFFRLFQFFLYRSLKTGEENKQLLLSDEAVKAPEDDLLGYGNYIKDLLSDIAALDLVESYSIGITGDWGQGKTSFLNLLRLKVEEVGDICMEFSPRSSKNASTIQEDFFNQLSVALQKYHTNLDHSFRRYTRALSIVDSGWLGKALSAAEVLSVDDEKRIINDAIQRIGKRLFVIIEDFDRLTTEEILEVLKVIDRNGDFSNTVYLTAYDKRYVNSVLSRYFGNESVQEYSDKYFQYDYALPVHQSAVITDFISDHLKKVFGSKDGFVMDDVDRFLKTNERIISSNLPSLRHAKRFLNIFCTRYTKIWKDVYFPDFFMLTLLRYVNVNAYYALARLEIVTPGSSFEYKSKCYNLIDSAVGELKDPKGRLKVLLDYLFPNTQNRTGNQQFVNHICWIDSFDLYFFDYRPDKAYFHDLVRLFQDDSEEDAFRRIDEWMGKGRTNDIEDFLLSKNANWISNASFLSRQIKLLCYLNHKQGRSSTIEQAISSFFEKETAKEYFSIIKYSEYKRIVKETLREALDFTPSELGFIFIQVIDGINDSHYYEQQLVFTKDELVEIAVWAQKYYYRLYGTPEFNFGVAFLLAGIKSTNLLSEVVEPAKEELIALMKLHPEDFAKEIVVQQVYESKRGNQLQLSFDKNFLVDQFFPLHDYKFLDWVSQLPEVTQYVLKAIYGQYLNGRRPLQVEALLGKYEKGDFQTYYEAITNDSIRMLDKSVREAIEEGSIFDYSGLRERIRANDSALRLSVQRLVETKAISEKYLNLKETVIGFAIGDFVQIRWKEFASLHNKPYFNLFSIQSIDADLYKLTGVSRRFAKQELRPVFIDDDVSQLIYYDPVVAAPTVGWTDPVPTHQVDYSFFMKHFENCWDYNDVSFKERVEKKRFIYVHEVQHWLREEFGSDDLKMRTE